MKTNLCDQCGKVAMPFVAIALQVHHKPEAAHVTQFNRNIELCPACATGSLNLRTLEPELEPVILKTRSILPPWHCVCGANEQRGKHCSNCGIPAVGVD